jgi:dethiobiotin synthetase
MTRAIFITGTDTEVGKTVITRAVVRALANRGLTVRAVKPVESGAEAVNGQLLPKDALAIMCACRRERDVRDIYAYAFPDPVSPHLAAKRVGKKIELEPIMALIDVEEQGADVIVAEGAGGLLAPLSDDLLYADLVAKAGLELVIVSPNVLGTINHTLLTIEAAKSRDIPIIGVILNRTPKSDFGNADAISIHGDVQILGEFPTTDTEDDDHLANLAEKHLELDKLL